MTEKGDKGADSVSLNKPVSDPAEPIAPAKAERPKQVTWVVAALKLTGLLALAASLSLYSLHSFIVHQLTTATAS